VECSDNATEDYVSENSVQNLGGGGKETQIITSVRQAWINQIHLRKSCWQMSDGQEA